MSGPLLTMLVSITMGLLLTSWAACRHARDRQCCAKQNLMLASRRGKCFLPILQSYSAGAKGSCDVTQVHGPDEVGGAIDPRCHRRAAQKKKMKKMNTNTTRTITKQNKPKKEERDRERGGERKKERKKEKTQHCRSEMYS